MKIIHYIPEHDPGPKYHTYCGLHYLPSEKMEATSCLNCVDCKECHKKYNQKNLN